MNRLACSIAGRSLSNTSSETLSMPKPAQLKPFSSKVSDKGRALMDFNLRVIPGSLSKFTEFRVCGFSVFLCAAAWKAARRFYKWRCNGNSLPDSGLTRNRTLGSMASRTLDSGPLVMPRTPLQTILNKRPIRPPLGPGAQVLQPLLAMKKV